MAAAKNQKLRLAVLVSGGGTNLQALLDRSAAGSLSAEVVVVVSDRADAGGLVRAEKAGVPTHVVSYRSTAAARTGLELSLPVDLMALDIVQRILPADDSGERLNRLARKVAAEQRLIEILDPFAPDLICLAGYMRLFTPFFLNHYNREDRLRILNIHPALLPAFPGQHGYEDTFSYGCKFGGVTVHFVDEGEDTGPILAQAVYPIWPQDDVEDVRRRGLQLEYEIYAQCINWLAAGQVELRRGPDGRISSSVTDPRYPEILKDWLKKAFA